MLSQSHIHFSLGHFPFDEAVEFVCSDGVGSISTNGVDDVNELFFGVTVFELFVDVLHIVEIKFSFSFSVEEGEVGSSSFFGEGVSLILSS